MSRLLRKLKGQTAQDRGRKYCEVCRSQDIQDAHVQTEKNYTDMMSPVDGGNVVIHDHYVDAGLHKFTIEPSSLKKSARNGCPSCAVLWCGIALFRDLDGDDQEEMVIEIDPYTKEYARTCLIVKTINTRRWSEDLRVEFYNPPGCNGDGLFGHYYTSEIMDKSITKGNNFPECFEFIKACLDNCLQNHDVCKQQAYWPKRVLDILPDGDRHGNSVILVEHTAGFEGRYIALSHCWGQSQMFTTTIATKNQRMRGITLSDLPTTFRHAISVSRKLDVRYLWIDSLCIIQDDTEDWALQSSEMAAIYSNSFLTIAASSSKDSSGGLFRKRHTSPYVVEVQDPRDRSSVRSMMVRESTDRVLFERTHTLYEEWFSPRAVLENSSLENHRKLKLPLLSRGWTFQERLLSTRILHFTSVELIFECNTEFRCECTTRVRSPIAGALFNSYAHYTGDILEDIISGKTTGVKETELPNHWQKLVAMYTTRQLTYQRDIFPALCGLAKAISARSDTLGVPLGAYCAGLWENYLPTGLCWRVDQSVTRAEEFCAPSWSWASVRGGVTWWDNDDRLKADEKFKIVAMNLVPTGRNPLGELQEGSSIVVRANVLPAVEIAGKSKVWYKLLSEEVELENQHEMEDPPERPWGPPEPGEIPELEVYFDLADTSMTLTTKSKSESGNPHFYCMELRQGMPDERGYWGRKNLIVAGIAIQKVTGTTSPETYERIGIFYAKGPPSFRYFKEKGEWRQKAEYKDITLV